MRKGLQWRAYFGFKPHEYYVVKDKDLERVKYAQISGKIVDIDGQQIRGSAIQRIEEDYRYYTGWYDSYSPTDGDDISQLNRDVPYKQLREREEQAYVNVRKAITTKNMKYLDSEQRKLLD